MPLDPRRYVLSRDADTPSKIHIYDRVDGRTIGWTDNYEDGETLIFALNHMPVPQGA